jgi:hypothetical protein
MNIFAIAYGADVDTTQLTTITNNSANVINITNNSTIDTAVQQLLNKTCELNSTALLPISVVELTCQLDTINVDLTVIVDTSMRMSDSSWQLVCNTFGYSS